MRVKGWGPSHASLALVSNRPNYEEARTGKALTGRKIVEELDRLLEGVRLADTYCTTLYREFVHDKEHEYTSADLERDGADLLTELAQIQPETIVTLGREATQFLLGDVDLESCWGIPWQTQHGVILPIHHPSAGMFSSDLACYVVAGFQTLGVYLAGGTKVRTLGDDEFPNPDYRLLVGDAVRTHLRPIKASPVLTCSADTEGWLWNPYSIQFSTTPGTGYMILAGDAIGLQHFHDWLYRVKPRLVVHSLLHDTPMLKLMAGIDIADFVYHDTQVMSFLLQLEPLGLKPGCLRHAGMTMNSYDDIIGAVADERARDYLTWVWDLEAFEHTERCQAEFDAKLAAGRRVKVLPKLPKSSLQKSVERCLKSNKPRDLWGRQDDALQTEAVKKVGFLPEATLNDVPQEKAVRYGCADSDGTTRLLGAYTPKIKALGLDSVYTLELSTYPLINRMAQIGIKPDLDHFAILDTMLEAEVEMLQDNLHTITEDENFNANSGDHVADYLFDRLGMTPLKMTKSGDRGSTNDKILEALERSTGHPAVVAIRKFRETYKLLHTFVRPLPEYVNRWPYDGRVHATYRTTRVVTGRLAASDPNVLAQPEHGAFAGDFKRGWVAEEGHVIVALDESQVELRGLGHLSQDPVICSTYRGERRNPDGSIIDLHAALAERIFGVPPHLQDKSKHRLPAKAVNFGIPMGMTCHGLKIELRKNGLDVDEDDAQRWLDETLELYVGVKAFKEACIAEAKQHGYIRCLSGRIRYIGGINSKDERIREEAERFSFSTKIQESATVVMKRAEALIWQELLPYYWKQGKYVEPILQIHDCLKFEVEEGLERDVYDRVAHIMTERVNPFSVPLAVEGEAGPNMKDMVPFK